MFQMRHGNDVSSKQVAAVIVDDANVSSVAQSKWIPELGFSNIMIMNVFCQMDGLLTLLSMQLKRYTEKSNPNIPGLQSVALWTHNEL